MQNKKTINAEIEFTKTFRMIAQAYEEIAVMKMRKVRNSVLSTRDYFEMLSEVFFDVKKEQRRQLEEAERKLKGQAKSKVGILLAGPASSGKIPTSVILDKTVSVLISANTTLYGDLIERIFQLFRDKTSKDDSDIVIVGRVGKRLYDEFEKKRQYLYFELPDVELTLEDLKPVIFQLIKYKQVMVYYGKFENVVNQVPTISNVSGNFPFLGGQTAKEPELIKDNKKVKIEESYLFEPPLEILLKFFGDLMLTSLFRQTIHESQLSRWASRIMSMEKAQQNIQAQIKKLNFSERKVKQLEDNNRQVERVSAMRVRVT